MGVWESKCKSLCPARQRSCHRARTYLRPLVRHTATPQHRPLRLHADVWLAWCVCRAMRAGGLNCQQAAVPQGRTTEPEMPLLSIYPERTIIQEDTYTSVFTVALFTIVRTRKQAQFSRSVLSDSSRPHELQHARPPCPLPTPRVNSNSCPLSQ